ncbi:MAG: ABC transporter substrate-binding protein [Promethearchaeota archaeon]
MKRSIVLTGLFLFTLYLIIFPLTISAKTEAVEVVISTGVQTTDALSNMVDQYNNLGKDCTVKLLESTWETQNQHDTYVTKLAAKDDSIDIISMDVIWPPEFTAAGWLEPVDDLFVSIGYTEDLYLEAPIKAGKYKGQHYGVPWFHDSGILFYRADILEYAFDEGIIPRNNPPETWSELYDWTINMLEDDGLVATFNGSDGILEGFIWQGREYEGMICDFMEYLGGTGTYSFLSEDKTKALFDTQPVKDALEYMKSLVGPMLGSETTVSPPAVLTYHEETSRAVWNDGNAIFHRNWPYCYRLSMDNEFLNGNQGSYGHPAGEGKIFGVTPMPPKDKTVVEPRTSCLGGWQLGLNIYSRHKEEAKEFMKWLTDVEQQKYYLLNGGQIPTREAVYSDPDVLSSDQAYAHELLPVFKVALPRPVHPDYPTMSRDIWPPIHSYLAGAMTLDDAVDRMDTYVNDILEDWQPIITTTTTTITYSETEPTEELKTSSKENRLSIGTPGWPITLLLFSFVNILVWKRRKL